MSDTKGEGCGVWPILLKGGKFEEACKWHDKAHLEQSWHQLNLSRYEIDRVFLLQMLTIAGKRKLRRLQAYVFYGLARVFGGWFWEGRR